MSMHDIVPRPNRRASHVMTRRRATSPERLGRARSELGMTSAWRDRQDFTGLRYFSKNGRAISLCFEVIARASRCAICPECWTEAAMGPGLALTAMKGIRQSSDAGKECRIGQKFDSTMKFEA